MSEVAYKMIYPVILHLSYLLFPSVEEKTP